MANDDDDVQVAYRISQAVTARMDKEIDIWQRDHPGVRLSRAEYTRMLVLKGMSDAAAAREAAKRHTARGS